jgi:hypothetical protein
MNTKTMTSTTSSDDVDCESPENLSGQDSIDYCRGYDQGFAQKGNSAIEIFYLYSSPLTCCLMIT